MKGRKGHLVALEYPGGQGGGMTAKQYQDQVLEPVLKPFYEQMTTERGQVLFQQDRASGHRAKMTVAYLDSHVIKLFPHPTKSPDMSPIEPLWNTLKKFIHKCPHIPTNLDKLIQAAWEAWDEITEANIDAHVKHMGDRVKDVLKVKGGHTWF